MSNFSYDKIGQYSMGVIEHITRNNRLYRTKGTPVIIDKNDGVFETFHDLCKDNKFTEASKYMQGGRDGNNWRKHLGFKIKDEDGVVRWTQIEKTKFSGFDIKIKTEEQEQITLEIFKQKLHSKTPDYKTWDEMFYKSPCSKIFPDLPKLTEWWDHFELQFNEVDKAKDIPNSSYQVMDYEAFMKWVSTLARKHGYAKKDSWNPADVWLIRDTDTRDKIKDALESAESIFKVNDILRIAYLGGEITWSDRKGKVEKIKAPKNSIVGISLKKSDRKKLHYDLINLEVPGQRQKMPRIQFKNANVNCEYKKGVFQSSTATLDMEDQGKKYTLSFRSNTTNLSSITFEFKGQSASAQLGKVSKPDFAKWLDKEIKDIDSKLKLPNHNNLPKKFTTKDIRYYKGLISTIKGAGLGANVSGIDNFVVNLEASYKNGGLKKHNGIIQQIVQFLYILAVLEQKGRLETILTRAYYYAQKKGVKYGFGPFGKLH